MGVKGVIEMTKRQVGAEKMLETLDLATDSVQDLIDWVKYLRVVESLRDLRFYGATVDDQRRSDRYYLPDIYQKHVHMEVALQSGMEAVTVLDFSRHGMRLQLFTPVSQEARIDCRLSTSPGPSEEISFKIKVVHCQPSKDKFIVGAEIVAIDEVRTYRVYRKLYGFILEKTASDGDDVQD
jgi:hypothetical protein